MRIFTGPLPSFLFVLFFLFLKKENDEAGFTIKAMIGHVRMNDWRNVNLNDNAPIP